MSEANEVSVGQRATDYIHKSDCSLHNEPALPNGPCDCRDNPTSPARDCAYEIYNMAAPSGSYHRWIEKFAECAEKHILLATAAKDQRVKELEAENAALKQEVTKWASRAGRADGELHELYEAALLKEGKC
jgi:hypothetical protein